MILCKKCPSWAIIVFFVLLNCIKICYCQSNPIQIGVFGVSGGSLGINKSSSTINNQINSYRNGFVQLGLYSIIKYKSDSSAALFKFLRIDLALASRGGTFDIGNGNLAKLTSSSIDICFVLPLSFPVSRDVDGYVGYGGVLEYRFKRGVIPVQFSNTFNDKNVFKPAFLAEAGFKFKTGSAFGLRAMLEFNDYPTRGVGFFIAHCPSSLSKKRVSRR